MREVRVLGQKASELLAEHERVKPSQRLATYADAERVWADVVMPKLKSFETMQDLWGEQQPPPEDSVWRANWKVPERYS